MTHQSVNPSNGKLIKEFEEHTGKQLEAPKRAQ
jgi:hypothetical protein